MSLLLVGCVSSRPVVVTEWPCRDWNDSSQVRMIPIQDYAPPRFICSERICFGGNPDRTQVGPCYYGCPEDRMPKYCEDYR
jgi:hypothetical protein